MVEVGVSLEMEDLAGTGKLAELEVCQRVVYDVLTVDGGGQTVVALYVKSDAVGTDEDDVADNHEVADSKKVELETDMTPMGWSSKARRGQTP